MELLFSFRKVKPRLLVKASLNSVFTPRHPATRPVLEDVVQAESVLDIDGLVAKALEGETWVRVKP